MPGTHPHNLPAPRTSLIGREADVSHTAGLVLDGPERLVTLTGVAGCGKTTLALNVAADLVDSFPDGVCLVELARLSDSSLVPTAVASAWGVAETAGGAAQDALTAGLRSKRLLLVLDNCEHVVDACATLIDRLLSSCPDLHVLATSREPLQIAGERQCRVAPLAVPRPGADLSPQALNDCPAVRLFVERAGAVDSGFSLTGENAPAVAGICTLLDGIPLAIELAACRVGVLTVTQIHERLDDSLRLLVGSSRSAPRRQQTLRAALDWSYELLSDEEQETFRRLSRFTAGWSLEAAEAVCDGAGRETEVLQVLARLVDKSLVLVEERDGVARYRFLEPVRQYGEQRLAELGETAAVQTMVTAFFVDLAERAERGLQSPDQNDWLLRLDREFDNMRAVVYQAKARGDVQAVLRLAGSLWWYLWLRHHLREGQMWLEASLMADAATPPDVRAKALMTRAFTCSFLAEYEEGLACGRAALALLEDGGPVEYLCGTLMTLGYITFGRGDLSEARALADRTAECAWESGSAWLEGQALLLLGQIAREQGERTQAADSFGRSLAAFEECGERWGVVAATQALTADEGTDSWRHSALAAMRVFLEQGDRLALIGALEYFAVRVEAGHPEVQVRLIAAAQAARDSCAGPLLGEERGDVERCLADARSALGESRYAALWTSGSATGLDQMVAALLGDAGQSPGSQPETPRRRRSGLPGSLTRREGDVVRLVALGCTDKEIAEALVITRGTASLHVHHILEKLGLRSRVQIADWAVAHGLVDPSSVA